MRKSTVDPETLQSLQIYAQFEGGSIHTAEKGALFFVITNESALADPEEGLEGSDLYKVLEFDSEGERSAYLAQRYPRKADENLSGTWVEI